MQGSYDKQTVTYAGFWARLCAYLLDWCIASAILLVAQLPLSVLQLLLNYTPLGGNVLFHYSIRAILSYLCTVAYFVFTTYYSGATLGKKALNLRVVSTDPDAKPSFIDILYRETVGRFLSGLILNIGYILIAADRQKAAWHDQLCDTRVIYAKKVTDIMPSFYGSAPAYAASYANPFTPVAPAAEANAQSTAAADAPTPAESTASPAEDNAQDSASSEHID